MLLLHGFCESHEIFLSIAEALSTQQRVIAPDLPGHGGTPWQPDLRHIDEVADWVMGFMDHLGCPRFELLGHSMGGYISAAMAVRRPQSISHLTLLHTTALADSEEKVAERNKAIRFVKRHGKLPFLKVFVGGLFTEPKEEWLEELHRISKGVDLRALLGFIRIMRDRPERLDALKASGVPVIYVTGAWDKIVPPLRNEEELREWPEAESVWFPKAGHMGMYESPADLIHLLQNKFS